MMHLISQYQNGNATVQLYDNGTRVIEYPDHEPLMLDYPFNIDIRVSNRCSFGSGTVCTFCHESATQNGDDCDFEWLKEIIIRSNLPRGTELAIGANHFSDEFIKFIEDLQPHGYIINLTVNLGHIKAYQKYLRYLIDNKFIYGLGISYRYEFRRTLIDPTVEDIISYPNSVLHVIAGIDDPFSILYQSHFIGKLLILGEKDFGFNEGNVDLNSMIHQRWYNLLGKFFNCYDIVSFDNLAVEQLKPQRFLDEASWKIQFQGEHSFYINAVDKYFAPSSRSFERNYECLNIKQYFKTLE